MQVFVRRQFETGDDGRVLSLNTLAELTSLLEQEGCAEAILKYQSADMPLVVELPPTAATRQQVTTEINQRLAKRMDLNRMAKGKQPLEPEAWMTAEQHAHFRATGDVNWRHYGSDQDRRFGLG